MANVDGTYRAKAATLPGRVRLAGRRRVVATQRSTSARTPDYSGKPDTSRTSNPSPRRQERSLSCGDSQSKFCAETAPAIFLTADNDPVKRCLSLPRGGHLADYYASESEADTILFTLSLDNKDSPPSGDEVITANEKKNVRSRSHNELPTAVASREDSTKTRVVKIKALKKR